MEFIQAIWVLIFNNILSRPAIFIGIIVMAGYMLLHKKWYEVLSGFIKAVAGYMILQLGAKSMVKAVTPIIVALQGRFGMGAVVADPNFGFVAASNALESIGLTASYAMITLLVAFIWNILLVAFRKQTKIRTLFTTGHIMVKQATVATWLVFFMIPSLRNMTGVVIVGFLIGTYWAVFSNLTVEATQNLTNNAGFAIGHQQMLAIWFTDKFAGRFGGKNSRNVDDIKLSGALSIFDDYVVATTVMMLIFFGSVLIILGPDTMREFDGANFPGKLSFAIYIFEKCISFAVNLVVLRTGVRMFVGELVESFKGISSSILKGSLPAVDCAVTYAFGSPNAVTLGFIFGAIGQLIAVIGLLVFRSPWLIIPGFVPMFFDNATIGLYANKRGGFRAIIIFCLGSGLIQVLGSAFAVGLFGLVKFGGYVGNFDWASLWIVIGLMIDKFAIPGIVISILAMLVIPQLQARGKGEKYFAVAEVEEDF
jgi:PTS system ascorbate-specific IIC component